MKKILTLSLLLIINILHVKSQDRIQEIKDGILMLASSKAQIVKKLKTMGFTYKSNYKNITEYKKETWQGEFGFTVIYDKINPNQVSVVSWMEHKMILSSISRELMELNFESIKGDYSTGIMGFKNVSRNLIVTLIIKDDSNTVFISIGAFNPKLPIKNNIPQQSNNPISTNKLFVGTKRFCEETQSWEYVVTINNQSIIIKSYPGKQNNIAKNKSPEITKGYIKNDKIYTKDVNGKYIPDLFKYKDGVFYQLNNENGYNDYKLCN